MLVVLALFHVLQKARRIVQRVPMIYDLSR
jgi:hypothetical protein